eukprot:Skav206350  [mRNA]  locus=scaffold3448:130658:131425:+ [translate_table: standard]
MQKVKILNATNLPWAGQTRAETLFCTACFVCLPSAQLDLLVYLEISPLLGIATMDVKVGFNQVGQAIVTMLPNVPHPVTDRWARANEVHRRPFAVPFAGVLWRVFAALGPLSPCVHHAQSTCTRNAACRGWHGPDGTTQGLLNWVSLQLQAFLFPPQPPQPVLLWTPVLMHPQHPMLQAEVPIAVPQPEQPVLSHGQDEVPENNVGPQTRDAPEEAVAAMDQQQSVAVISGSDTDDDMDPAFPDTDDELRFPPHQ